MTKTFFYFNLLCVAVLMLLSSCSNGNYFEPSEEFNVSLPLWPPESERQLYPKLSRWKVEVAGGNFVNTENPSENSAFFSRDTFEIAVKANKNQPVAVIAVPVTLDSSGNEVEFFKCAGFIYPFCSEKELTFENGFTAEVLKIGIKSDSFTSSKKKAEFLMKFNWNRFMEVIETKTESSLENLSETGIYNPWKNNPSKISGLICSKKFYQTALNTSGTFGKKLELQKDLQKFMISSYIPENQILEKEGVFTLQNDEINFYSLYNEYGVIIKAKNSEIVSPVFINLPIIKE